MGEGAESESDYADSESVCQEIEDERGGEDQVSVRMKRYWAAKKAGKKRAGKQ